MGSEKMIDRLGIKTRVHVGIRQSPLRIQVLYRKQIGNPVPVEFADFILRGDGSYYVGVMTKTMLYRTLYRTSVLSSWYKENNYGTD